MSLRGQYHSEEGIVGITTVSLAMPIVSVIFSYSLVAELILLECFLLH